MRADVLDAAPAMTGSASTVSGIPGVIDLWSETIGDPAISVAILDGPVDIAHPALRYAKLDTIDVVGPPEASATAMQHGTHIASLIFGAHDSPVHGLAPRCRGLILPIFHSTRNGTLAPCSQLDLARALGLAIQHGANIANISGGQLAPTGEAHPILANAVAACIDAEMLVVAAVGNDGCPCLHIPSALPSVLAVGAMTSEGDAAGFSNWGKRYQTRGILAPGEEILGASDDGGVVARTGTSVATAIVSGVAALLLSAQSQQRLPRDARAVGSAIIDSASSCDERTPSEHCHRLLAGRLNVRRARTLLEGDSPVTDPTDTHQAAAMAAGSMPGAAAIPGAPVEPSAVEEPIAFEGAGEVELQTELADILEATTQSSAERVGSAAESAGAQTGCTCAPGSPCSCGKSVHPQLVYVIGEPAIDFGSEARFDSIRQHMRHDADPHRPEALLDYLSDNPWDSASVIWCLNLDATPVYAIRPEGAFAREGYQRLSEFLRERTAGTVERVSVPGAIVGQQALMSGQIVPVIQPAMRCMYSWTTSALAESVAGKAPGGSAKAADRESYAAKLEGVSSFLERVYSDLRNLGLTPRDRAINYAATNAMNAGRAFELALREQMQLDTVEAEPSPISRPDSECWDVKLTFFAPARQFEQARRVYRFAVDVSDVCPVMVGDVRSWYVR
jgi:cyanobactin maturation PatA/PatG family protease